MCILNPYQKEKALENTPGIVLIVDGLVEAFAGTNKECFESGTIKKELLHNKVERTDKSTSL